MKTMKRHILPLLLVLIGTATLCGCSKDELPVTDPAIGNATVSATPFTITVTDGGYAPADAHPHTRATENGYQTQFTAGDRIGVFAVKDGAIATGVDNLCLTAQPGDGGNALVWTDASGKAPINVLGATYYAYYPYQETLTGELVPTATDAEGFFANVITGWTPAADQSTHANYTDQDLMIAQGAMEGEKSLSFSMQHKMALVVIELPKEASYKLSNDNNYTSWTLASGPTPGFKNFTPYRIDDGNTYRYLIKPSTNGELSGSYINGTAYPPTWSFSPSVSAGNYKIFQVDGGNDGTVAITHTLSKGDFYMKDGSLVAGSTTTLTAQQQQDCIGIVFWVGDATAKDQTLATDHSTCTHGLVVALKDAIETGGGKIAWQSSKTSVQGWLDSNQSGGFLSIQGSENANDRVLNNIQGYNNTKAIEAYNEANSTFVLPVEELSKYRTKVSTPSSSSGWYLPSAKELTLLCGKEVADIYKNDTIGGETIDFLDGIGQTPGQFSKLGDYAAKTEAAGVYWSSTECSDDKAFGISFLNTNIDSFCKNGSHYARCILAF